MSTAQYDGTAYRMVSALWALVRGGMEWSIGRRIGGSGVRVQGSPKAPTLPEVTQDSHTVQMRKSVHSHSVPLGPPHTSVNVRSWYSVQTQLFKLPTLEPSHAQFHW